MPKSVPLRKVRDSRPKAKRTRGMAATNCSGPNVKQACTLGIDIGSHRTRACLWTKSGPKVIENNRSFGYSGTCFPGDFPSELYVFDPQPSPAPMSPASISSSGDPMSPVSTLPAPLYLFDRQDASRQSVSAKYVFYVLANAKDKLLEQYPPVHHLRARGDDPEFRARLRQAVMELLSVLRDRAIDMCRVENVYITKIGLTMPVQWTLEFEEVYSALVSEVFGVDKGIIFFFTETEALARYMYKYHAPKMDPRGEYTTMLFIDYGGHNMNGCLFAVARDVDDASRNGFFRIGKAFGAGGGSEQWEHHIAMWFSTQWYDQTQTPAPPMYLEEFLSKFRPQKEHESDSRKAITMICAQPDDSSCFLLTLDRETMHHTWRKGIERPLTVAAREMARLAEMAKTDSDRVPKPVVVVSGGTARSPAVKSYMKDLEKEHKIPVVFTDNLVGLSYDSAKVAMAAAYVVSETLTVEQFFSRGAAIGIQMKQAPEQGKPKPPVRLWDYSGKVLLKNMAQPPLVKPRDDSPKVEIAVRYGDEFRLICDPFYDLLPVKEKGAVRAKRAYDLIYLDRRQQGTWEFRLSLAVRPRSESAGDDDDNLQLVLEQRYKQRREFPWVAMNTLYLPLYFDSNSGSVQVGARDRSIAELDLQLPPQPEEGEDGCSSSSDSDEPDEDDDYDDYGHGGGQKMGQKMAASTQRRNRGTKPQYPLKNVGPFIEY